MEIAQYLANIPKLHTWDSGKTWNTGGFQAATLQAFHDLIGRNNCETILETGAGNSTIAFLLTRPAKVISIAPDLSLFQRITSFCGSGSIPTAPLQAVIERSEWALPSLAKEHKVDFALIDGGHGMPTVFIDLFYVNYMVRKGGLIAMDDAELHSVGEAISMLKEQPQFALESDLGKTIVFRKLEEFREFPDWSDLPYIRRKSATPRT